METWRRDSLRHDAGASRTVSNSNHIGCYFWLYSGITIARVMLAHALREACDLIKFVLLGFLDSNIQRMN